MLWLTLFICLICLISPRTEVNARPDLDSENGLTREIRSARIADETAATAPSNVTVDGTGCIMNTSDGPYREKERQLRDYSSVLEYPWGCVHRGTIDINLPEYQYLSDHLTEKECRELFAALHFHGFELPKDINAAERRLPKDVSCLELLLHWNSAPREGRGQTHVEVCSRLNQIGREDLAQWLSKAVFHEISKDLKNPLTAGTEDTTFSPVNITEEIRIEGPMDEAPWWRFDSFLEALAAASLGTLLFGSVFLCFLCCLRVCKSNDGYTELRSSKQ